MLTICRLSGERVSCQDYNKYNKINTINMITPYTKVQSISTGVLGSVSSGLSCNSPWLSQALKGRIGAHGAGASQGDSEVFPTKMCFRKDDRNTEYERKYLKEKTMIKVKSLFCIAGPKPQVLWESISAFTLLQANLVKICATWRRHRRFFVEVGDQWGSKCSKLQEGLVNH